MIKQIKLYSYSNLCKMFGVVNNTTTAYILAHAIINRTMHQLGVYELYTIDNVRDKVYDVLHMVERYGTRYVRIDDDIKVTADTIVATKIAIDNMLKQMVARAEELSCGYNVHFSGVWEK